jgi:hypothetical protein
MPFFVSQNAQRCKMYNKNLFAYGKYFIATIGDGWPFLPSEVEAGKHHQVGYRKSDFVQSTGLMTTPADTSSDGGRVI